MVILDISVVNIALPSIQTDLGFAIGDLQWVVTAYTLAFGGLLLLGGKAADLFGRRRMFFVGLGIFTLASAAASVAGSPTTLLAGRVFQGIGAAMLSPAALSLVAVTFPDGQERTKAMAAWAAVAASGGAVGVLVGGFLCQIFDWPAIFLINIPVALAVWISARRVIPADSSVSGGERKLDLSGALFATTSLVALIYGLVEAPDAGWLSGQTLGLIGLAACGLLAFVRVESRKRNPLVDLAVFRRRTTVTALLLMVTGMGTVLSAFFFISIYLQQVLGYSALETGLQFLPGAIALILAAHAGGHLVARLGVKAVLSSGMLLGAIGAWLLSGIDAQGSFVGEVLPGLMVLDLGIGLAASGIYITAMSGVEHHEAGAVSGLVSTSHEIGVALILPILSTVAVSGIDTHGAGLAGLPPASLAAGLGDGFSAAALISVGACLLALIALRRSDVVKGAQGGFAH
jgi:EmrB/QacA subfamily drug resistance transporter